MGKRKAFIDKSKSVTFRLIPAVDTKPKPVGNPELVNVVTITEEELEQREKYGIYYADNYNYMSHLKSRDELPAFHLSEKSTIALPKEALKLATHIIEVKGKEIPLNATKKARLLSVSASVVDIEDEMDPEILEMLNEGEEGFGEEGEIEDDFLNLAGGVEMPEGRRIFEEFRKTAQMSDSEIEDEDMDDASDEAMDDGEPADKKPHSILKKAPAVPLPDKTELDVRFNQFYENMEGSDFEDEDAEYSEDEPEVDKPMLENLADEYQDEKAKAFTEKPDQLSKHLTLKAYRKQELERDEETEQIEVDSRSKKAKWDCESVTSTYSNIYNHPTLIREASKRKPKLKKILDNDEEMECETESVRSSRSTVSTIRLRGETTEDRRERKRAVKEERRERRVEKKTLKEMFKDEKKVSDAQRGHVFISGRPIP